MFVNQIWNNSRFQSFILFFCLYFHYRAFAVIITVFVEAEIRLWWSLRAYYTAELRPTLMAACFVARVHSQTLLKLVKRLF